MASVWARQRAGGLMVWASIILVGVGCVSWFRSGNVQEQQFVSIVEQNDRRWALCCHIFVVVFVLRLVFDKQMWKGIAAFLENRYGLSPPHGWDSSSSLPERVTNTSLISNLSRPLSNRIFSSCTNHQLVRETIIEFQTFRSLELHVPIVVERLIRGEKVPRTLNGNGNEPSRPADSTQRPVSLPGPRRAVETANQLHQHPLKPDIRNQSSKPAEEEPRASLTQSRPCSDCVTKELQLSTYRTLKESQEEAHENYKKAVEKQEDCHKLETENSRAELKRLQEISDQSKKVSQFWQESAQASRHKIRALTQELSDLSSHSKALEAECGSLGQDLYRTDKLIWTAVRIRPDLLATDRENSKAGYLVFNGPRTEIRRIREAESDRWAFDRIFDACDDDRVVSQTFVPLVDYALQGHRACIIADGFSGTGKTWTMIGSPDSVVRSTIKRVFDQGRDRSYGDRGSEPPAPSDNAITDSEEYTGELGDEVVKWMKRVDISIKEVYKGKVIDLLKTHSSKHNGSCVDMSDVDKALECLTQRVVSKTGANERSSRGHLVITVTLFTQWQRAGPKKRGKLCLVDLAGAEEFTGNDETKYINKSRSALHRHLIQLAETGQAPPGEENLTKELKDHLRCPDKAKSAIFLLTTISSAIDKFDQTTQSLEYSTGVYKAQNRSVVERTTKSAIKTRSVDLSKPGKSQVTSKQRSLQASTPTPACPSPLVRPASTQSAVTEPIERAA